MRLSITYLEDKWLLPSSIARHLFKIKQKIDANVSRPTQQEVAGIMEKCDGYKMLPPNCTLFHLGDSTQRFVGTATGSDFQMRPADWIITIENGATVACSITPGRAHGMSNQPKHDRIAEFHMYSLFKDKSESKKVLWLIVPNHNCAPTINSGGGAKTGNRYRKEGEKMDIMQKELMTINAAKNPSKRGFKVKSVMCCRNELTPSR